MICFMTRRILIWFHKHKGDKSMLFMLFSSGCSYLDDSMAFVVGYVEFAVKGADHHVILVGNFRHAATCNVILKATSNMTHCIL